MVDRDPAHQVAKTVDIDGSNLLDKDTCGLTGNLDLRSKRCGPSAGRGRSDDHNRSWQHRVGLDEDAKSSTMLFVPAAFGQAQFVDITPLHGGPSRSELLHQLGDGAHLRPVGFVGLEASRPLPRVRGDRGVETQPQPARIGWRRTGSSRCFRAVQGRGERRRRAVPILLETHPYCITLRERERPIDGIPVLLINQSVTVDDTEQRVRVGVLMMLIT